MAPTLDQLIHATEARRQAAERRAEALKGRVSRWTASLEAQDITQVPADQEARADETVRQWRAAQDEAKEAAAQLAAFREAAAEERAERDMRAVSIPTAAASRRPAYDRVMRVGREQRTYNPETDRTGTGFILDIARDALRLDHLASERLARHAREEEVERGGQQVRVAGDALTTNFAGLTVPQYLTDLYAPAVAAMRPFADICTQHDLPPNGLTINISQITTATSAALQTTQLTGVSATSIDDTLLTENVQTIAGQQTLSRQSVERGTISEDVTTQDLFKRVATALDSTLINQTVTGLEALSVGTTTAFTSTAPTAALLWPKLFSAQNNVETALLGLAAPSHFLFSPRRWNWATSQVSTSWPTFGSASVPPQLAGITLTNQYDSPGVRAVLANGMKVVTDANIPTTQGTGNNQDAIYCVAADECHLWTDPAAPVLIRAEQAQAAELGVLIVVYLYAAYCFRRISGSVQSVTGTGLVTPTW